MVKKHSDILSRSSGIGSNLVDPYHIDDLNSIISKVASLNKKDLAISKGIDRMTTKVCNTAIKLAEQENDQPLNCIDKAIAMNLASSSSVEHDINRIISEKMNFGPLFKYPENFHFNRTRKNELVPRDIPEKKYLGIDRNYAMEALYSQQTSGDEWYIVVTNEWFLLSTEEVFKVVPEMLPMGYEYSTT